MEDGHLNQALKEKSEECVKIAKENAPLKHEMESIVMRLTKEIEERKNKRRILLHP